MTATIHGRLLMLGNGCRCHDYGGWTRESCQWFEMNGMVRRLYIGDGLAVNAHEDRFLGDGIDSISVSGRGVNIMLNVDGTGIAFFHQGFEYADYWRHFRVRFSSDDTRGVPSLPQNIAYDGGWDPGEVRRLLSVVCHGDVAAVSDDPVVRLGDGLSVTVDTEAPGPPGFPQADLVYRQGAVSVELRGTLSRCREGVAVVSKFESFAVIALPGGSADAIGGAAPCAT